jgi:hypothetical protein
MYGVISLVANIITDKVLIKVRTKIRHLTT